jgi:hypothetical protein
MRILLTILSLFLFTLASLGQEKERPSQPDLPGDFVFDFGLSMLYQSDELENKPWKSTNFGAYYMYTLKLNNFVTVNPQLGFTFERHDFFNAVNFLETDEREIVFDTIADVPLLKNKLITNYLELPLEIRFYPLKTIEGEGIFIGIGGSIGLRTASFTKIKYTVDNENRKASLNDAFDLNAIRYGLQARIGLKGVNLFYKVYLSDMFNEGPGGTNPRTMSFGINVTGF